METSRHIGFTKEYYTLWDITTDVVWLNEYTSYNTIRYTYLRNLSKNELTAIEYARNMGATSLIPDHDLYGRNNSFECNSEKKIDLKKLEKCEKSDLIMICCSNNIENTKDAREKAIEILLLKGYFELFEGIMVDSDYINDIKTVYNNWVNRNNNIKLSFVAEHNPNSDGILYNYLFSGGVVQNYYNGFNYYLPNVNGKGKRVKGKTIEILEYSLVEEDLKDTFISVISPWLDNRTQTYFYTGRNDGMSDWWFTEKAFTPMVVIKKFAVK